MAAPERVETDRLVLRRPTRADVDAIFTRYASDPEVTRFLSWPRHTVIDHTVTFLEFSDLHWQQWPAGPYLVESRSTGAVLGGTGLGFETQDRASTGYVLARDAWGYGYATEALRAMIPIAAAVGVQYVYALCHPEHDRSRRVLQKCGFKRETLPPRYSEFPNLRPGEPIEVLCYARNLRVAPETTG